MEPRRHLVKRSYEAHCMSYVLSWAAQVLNILALRFANRELGRLFHADNVSIVRITFKEDINVAGRAGYFDGYGIIRARGLGHAIGAEVA